MRKKMSLVDEFNIERWSNEKIHAFQEQVLSWYDQNKRDLPWRQSKDPYKIWVSEIMLQQTQVQTVIPYYERFIQKLPTVEDLAQVDSDQLLKLWEGLGYYSRVKNMQSAAQQLMADWDGQFPKQAKDLEKLKGIGPYTAGAIASIAFNQPTPAIDGNAMRVFSRLFKIDADITKAKTKRLFSQLVAELIPHDRPGDFNQAIMDIGSQKSMPKVYIAENNPVVDFDLSYQDGSWPNYPVKKTKSKVKKEIYYAFIVKDEAGSFLLEKRPANALLADFWTFPLVEQEKFLTDQARAISVSPGGKPLLSQTDQFKVCDHLNHFYRLDSQIQSQAIGQVNHVFSHRHWMIYVFIGQAQPKEKEKADLQWVQREDFGRYAFPVPQQKMLSVYDDYLST